MVTVFVPPETNSRVSAPRPPAVTCPVPAFAREPSAFMLILAFLSSPGTVSVELVSPALVSVIVVPSKVIPKSLFRNLFVLISPVPPLFVGTALLKSPVVVKPALAAITAC